jgi:hypothetical protein
MSVPMRMVSSASNLHEKVIGQLPPAFLAGLTLSLVLGLSACGRGGDDKRESSQGSEKRPVSAAAATGGKIVPKLATAYSSTPANPPNLAIDNDGATAWISGASAPGWIQLDLGEPVTFSRIRLNVMQDPPGPTKHQIFAGPTPDSLTAIGTLEGNTTNNQWLELSHAGDNVRYLKILTLSSPSWVAWREIEIYR